MLSRQIVIAASSLLSYGLTFLIHLHSLLANISSAGDIIFECVEGKIHIYVSKENYSVDFLIDENQSSFDNYIGTLVL